MKHLPLTHPQALAISSIREFFDIWSLHSVLQIADTIFRKAASDKAWRPPNPYNAVHCCRQLRRLSKAAYALSNSFNETLAKKMIVNPGEHGPDISLSEKYKGNWRYATAFSDMPRQLSAAEYRYPAKALSNYCNYRSKLYWKRFYKELAQCALSSTSIIDMQPAGKLFPLRLHVFKLIEACHLIYVRLGKMALSISDGQE